MVAKHQLRCRAASKRWGKAWLGLRAAYESHGIFAVLVLLLRLLLLLLLLFSYLGLCLQNHHGGVSSLVIGRGQVWVNLHISHLGTSRWTMSPFLQYSWVCALNLQCVRFDHFICALHTEEDALLFICLSLEV